MYSTGVVFVSNSTSSFCPLIVKIHAARRSAHLSSDSAIAPLSVRRNSRAVACMSNSGLGGSQQRTSSTVRLCSSRCFICLPFRPGSEPSASCICSSCFVPSPLLLSPPPNQPVSRDTTLFDSNNIRMERFHPMPMMVKALPSLGL